MSNLKLLSSKEALKRQMERIEKRKGKRVAHVPIPRVQETINVEPSNPVELATKKKKRPGSDDESSSINVKFSSDVYVYLNLGLKLNKKVSSLTTSNTKLKKEVKEVKALAATEKKEALERLDKATDEAVIETRGKLME
ncbi:hypothetical protein Q3G72_020668 [Acer saccharum]|nr:hypothetical protein Q3G72_020668 [Acer saccharum]